LDAYNKTLTAYLDELGVLGPDLTAAHCVWLDDDDIARLADRGCSIAHNPGSNLRLGSGIAPARRMLDRGLNVGLGTDGSHCSDNQNMFEAMRLASFVSRVADVDPNRWISTDDAAKMATNGSARALGFGDRIGRLEVGCEADIVLLDLANINFVPFNDPTNQLVHSEDSSAVCDVMIGGKWVLRNREFVTFDFRLLRSKVEDSVARLRSSAAGLKGAADQLAEYVSDFCMGSHSRPHHINRLCLCGPATGFSDATS
ncbi:amidohydrolase, partial [Mesorhizobium sp. M7D.F.Ca.US.004.03.1.1]|uniref:amidohydrolase family protein n=1 Tax=Mesorhizobium sp. M7D.F.Ca.US.004.03.1.1 TaxID=2496702 RepID=UPI000FD1C59B